MKLAHFCVVCEDAFLFGLGVLGLCGFIGKVLLCRMLCIMFSLSWYSLCCKLYEFSLLYKYLTAAYLCCIGWLEAYGMMVSVNVRFLYMAVLKPVGVLHIDKSR